MADSPPLFAGALPVSRETLERLDQFASIFQQWAKRINLVAPSTLADFQTRHLDDSAQLLLLAPEAKHWIDVGSGGGFPGLVIAALLQGQPGCRVDLVESNRKKTAFLQAAAARVAPSARIHAHRIEDVADTLPTPDVVTARALASLTDLLDLTAPWLTRGAAGLFHKGRGYREEIEESRALWDYDLVVHPSRVEPDSVILEITHLRHTANKTTAV